MKISILIILSILLMSSKCTKKDEELISVYNQSSKAIYCIDDSNYPDTTLTNRMNQGGPDKIEPFKSIFYHLPVNETFELNPIFQVFFINADTFNLKGLTYVYNNNVVESRKTFTEEQIRASDFKVYYP